MTRMKPFVSLAAFIGGHLSRPGGYFRRLCVRAWLGAAIGPSPWRYRFALQFLHVGLPSRSYFGCRAFRSCDAPRILWPRHALSVPTPSLRAGLGSTPPPVRLPLSCKSIPYCWLCQPLLPSVLTRTTGVVSLLSCAELRQEECGWLLSSFSFNSFCFLPVCIVANVFRARDIRAGGGGRTVVEKSARERELRERLQKILHR